MEALSVSELKGLCQQRKLPVSGTKAELIERLTRGSLASGSSTSASAASSRALTKSSTTAATKLSTASVALFPSDYDSLTIPQLKDLCRERMLPVGGIKDDVVARLKASDPRNMTLVQLKERCRDAALPVTGTKVDLAERVMKSMSGGTTALLQTKSVDELKDLCRERGVAVSGKKDELIDRLKQAWPASSSTPSTTTKASLKATAEKPALPSDAGKKTKTKAAVAVSPYDSLTMWQLKELCREKKLMVGGTKDELVGRLNKAKAVAMSRPLPPPKTSSSNSIPTTTTAASTATADSGYDSMMVPQLKDLCRSRTLPVMGTKEELVKRLREHDDVVRAMFKKRKSPSSDSITTNAFSTAPSSTGKRQAASDRPKPKKIKTTALKSTGGAFMRPPMAKNISAFAVPTTEMFVARKSAPPKAKKTPPPTTTNGRYLVYSTCAYPPDGFHTYEGPGTPKHYGTFATKDEANDRVSKIFYHSNPWGLGSDEMDDDLDITESWKDGLLRLEVCPPDSEEWVVGVHDIAKAADDDGDVIMVSGSDTEEDVYAY